MLLVNNFWGKIESMVKHNQDGSSSVIVITLLSLFLLAALGFGGWAFSSRQDFKNNTDAKIAIAVSAAIQKEDVIKDAQAAQAAKNPLLTYTGPEAYGSIVLQYPRTWSGYVNTAGSNNTAVDGYFNPGVIPSIGAGVTGGQPSEFAFRMQVLNQSYSQTLQSLAESQQSTLTTVAYSLPMLPKVVGVEVTGVQTVDTNNTTQVTMVILPVRTETIELWTEGPAYLSDFNNIILPNFSFSP